MVKRAVRHIGKGLMLSFELLGFLSVLLFIAWMTLLWRLSQGPLNVDFLTTHLEKSFNTQQEGFLFHIGKTELRWGGRFEPFEIAMEHVQVSRTDKTPVVAVNSIGILLSKRYLMLGKLVPRVIRLDGPALRVVHEKEGGFNLNINDEAERPAPADAPAIQPSPADQTALAQAILMQMKDADGFGLFDKLQQIVVTNADVFYEDKQLGFGWKSKASNLTFERVRGGLAAGIDSHLLFDEEQKGFMRANLLYNWGTRTTDGVIYFSGLNPAVLAKSAEQFKKFEQVNLPFKGSVAFKLGEDFLPESVRYILGADAGSFNYDGLYQKPTPIESIYTTGDFNLKTWQGKVDRLRISLGGKRYVEMKAAAYREGSLRKVAVNAMLGDIPADELTSYWPDSLTPLPREWVTKQLTKGMVDKATLKTVLSFDDAYNLNVETLGGTVDFSKMKVDYFPPLMPVLGVEGHCTYDKSNFNLSLKDGTLGDMKADKAEVRISNLGAPGADEHPYIDIDVSIKGPVKTGLKLLDSDPLNFISALGLKAAETAGTVDAKLNLQFSIHKGLDLGGVKVKASGKVNGLLLKGVAAGHDLNEGITDVTVDNETLHVKGNGVMESLPIAFDWSKYFSAKAAVQSKVQAQVTLADDSLKKFGAPAEMNLSGKMPVSITYQQAQDKTASLDVKGDLQGLAFNLPWVSWSKPAESKGTVALTVSLDKSANPLSLSNIELQSEGAVLKGGLVLNASRDGLRSAAFNTVRFGNTDISVDLKNDDNTGYKVNIAGTKLDVSSFLETKGASGADASEENKKSVPLELTLNLKHLITGKDKELSDSKVYLRQNEWKRPEHLELEGKAGQGNVLLRYASAPQGKGKTLRFEADDAGAALAVLGLTKSVRGGKLAVNGVPNPQGGARDILGQAVLTDFTLVDAPVLARLLNAMSLTGVIDLLNGKGIAFKKMRSDFYWAETGRPDSEKKSLLLGLKEGQTSGASLGLSFEGSIDVMNKVLNLNGTIVPVSDINKLLNVIPLVGSILTAGGEGVIAATYTIKGDSKDPSVLVNPLSVLAPGLLRKMFFEK